jgi:hypothetical protein
MLLEEFLKPLVVSQSAFAIRLGVSWDLWRALRSSSARQIARLTPLPRAG